MRLLQKVPILTRFGIRFVVKFGSEDATEGMAVNLRGINLVMICSSGHGISCMNGSTGLRMNLTMRPNA